MCKVAYAPQALPSFHGRSVLYWLNLFSAAEKNMLNITRPRSTNLCIQFLGVCGIHIFPHWNAFSSFTLWPYNSLPSIYLVVCATNIGIYLNTFQTHYSVWNVSFTYHTGFLPFMLLFHRHSALSYILFKFPKLPRRGPNTKLNLFISLTWKLQNWYVYTVNLALFSRARCICFIVAFFAFHAILFFTRFHRHGRPSLVDENLTDSANLIWRIWFLLYSAVFWAYCWLDIAHFNKKKFKSLRICHL